MQTLNELNTSNLAVKPLSIIKFTSGNTLFIDETNGEIKLHNSKNELQLVINISDKGLIINANVAELNLTAIEQLNLSSKKINIQASEQLNMKAVGNLVIEAGKDCLIEVAGTNKNIARVQQLTAKLGNVEIKANDDVKLDGESVKLNCEEP